MFLQDIPMADMNNILPQSNAPFHLQVHTIQVATDRPHDKCVLNTANRTSEGVVKMRVTYVEGKGREAVLIHPPYSCQI